MAQLCFRPGFNQREFPAELHLTRPAGVPGERWRTQSWLRLPDCRPDPNSQVSTLPLHILNVIWTDRNTPHPGDTIIADLDTSIANLPPGTRLQAGTAILRVSAEFNEDCMKWKARYGQAAKDRITAPGHPNLRLRGILCAMEQDGTIRTGDRITKL